MEGQVRRERMAAPSESYPRPEGMQIDMATTTNEAWPFIDHIDVWLFPWDGQKPQGKALQKKEKKTSSNPPEWPGYKLSAKNK